MQVPAHTALRTATASTCSSWGHTSRLPWTSLAKRRWTSSARASYPCSQASTPSGPRPASWPRSQLEDRTHQSRSETARSFPACGACGRRYRLPRTRTSARYAGHQTGTGTRTASSTDPWKSPLDQSHRCQKPPIFPGQLSLSLRDQNARVPLFTGP